jgi:hypothetical protein
MDLEDTAAASPTYSHHSHQLGCLLVSDTGDGGVVSVVRTIHHMV